ncbi:hypothetical protein [Desulfogranum mediterraneum]|uniref:hypothetical protein n=1 Tax=Desulfogranum mediterraneum TaxID=160661 RepID=UPI0004298FC2|nr:hypothetical protein [Desulfogranum mediterraneum]
MDDTERTNAEITGILEQYIHGKDDDRYPLLEEIYDQEALLSFSVRTAGITFPERIEGNREIARVLSADFNTKYKEVRTYYLAPVSACRISLAVTAQPWLVLMRERTGGLLKVGCGLYDWHFCQAPDSSQQIRSHRITIAEMIDLPDQSDQLLAHLQQQLPYPWTDRQTVVSLLARYEELSDLVRYLQNQPHK